MPQSAVNKPVRPEESVGGPLQWEYILSRLIGKAYTATLVKVNEVLPGGIGPVGFLSATDLIQQTNGNNEGVPNVPMENMPYFRLQGGANAIVIDPKPGDIGIAIFANQDLTVAKQNKQEGPPPSLRTHDVSDGLYIGGLLNGAPAQWIRFLDSGINITSTGPVSVDATVLQVNCPIISTADITDKTSSMQDMRDQYNQHAGHLPSGGATPSVPME